MPTMDWIWVWLEVWSKFLPPWTTSHLQVRVLVKWRCLFFKLSSSKVVNKGTAVLHFNSVYHSRLIFTVVGVDKLCVRAHWTARELPFDSRAFNLLVRWLIVLCSVFLDHQMILRVLLACFPVQSDDLAFLVRMVVTNPPKTFIC